jgi:hypothetical protein
VVGTFHPQVHLPTLSQGVPMTKDDHNRDVNQKQPGERPEGAQHYNPGNQSGKSQSSPPDKPTSEQKQKSK